MPWGSCTRCCGRLALFRSLLPPVPSDQRGDVADEDADRGGQQDHHDQRRVEAGEEDFEADFLRVLKGDDEDEGAEDADEPGAPVDGLLLLLHLPILVPGISRTYAPWEPRNDPTRPSPSATNCGRCSTRL